MNSKTPLLLALSCIFAACAGSPGTSHDEQAPLQDEPPVFGHLVFREHTVTIWLGDDGPLYTVATNDGQVLATRVDEDYLAANFPELRDMLDDSLAVGDLKLIGY